jgi:hypothetical protein
VPRALAIRYLTLAPDERAPYRARLAERVASARASGFHLWVFAEQEQTAPGPADSGASAPGTSDPGTAERLVEFVEAGGAAALDAALTQDALLAEGLDFRHAPSTAEGLARWTRYTGVADG